MNFPSPRLVTLPKWKNNLFCYLLISEKEGGINDFPKYICAQVKFKQLCPGFELGSPISSAQFTGAAEYADCTSDEG